MDTVSIPTFSLDEATAENKYLADCRCEEYFLRDIFQYISSASIADIKDKHLASSNLDNSEVYIWDFYASRLLTKVVLAYDEKSLSDWVFRDRLKMAILQEFKNIPSLQLLNMATNQRYLLSKSSLSQSIYYPKSSSIDFSFTDDLFRDVYTSFFLYHLAEHKIPLLEEIRDTAYTLFWPRFLKETRFNYDWQKKKENYQSSMLVQNHELLVDLSRLDSWEVRVDIFDSCHYAYTLDRGSSQASGWITIPEYVDGGKFKDTDGFHCFMQELLRVLDFSFRADPFEITFDGTKYSITGEKKDGHWYSKNIINITLKGNYPYRQSIPWGELAAEIKCFG